MDKYDVFVFCDTCEHSHPTGIIISLHDGPDKTESIGSLYAGKELPIKAARFNHDYFHCSKTKRKFVQRDTDKIFLVPIRQ